MIDWYVSLPRRRQTWAVGLATAALLAFITSLPQFYLCYVRFPEWNGGCAYLDTDEFAYAAQSWAQPWRVVLKAEVMGAGDNPRFVVTSLEAPTPQMLYEDLYCARGTCENAIKAVKVDLRSDRTSATTFLANAMRLLLACAA